VAQKGLFDDDDDDDDGGGGVKTIEKFKLVFCGNTDLLFTKVELNI
jgi:hypothetical protein